MKKDKWAVYLPAIYIYINLRKFFLKGSPLSKVRTAAPSDTEEQSSAKVFQDTISYMQWYNSVMVINIHSIA